MDPEDFDPKTFFKMHGNQRFLRVLYPVVNLVLNYDSCVADSNGDGFFDETELEALFTKEVFMILYSMSLFCFCMFWHNGIYK